MPPLTVEVDPALEIPLKDCWGTDTSFTGLARTGVVCFAALPNRENAQHLFAKDVLTRMTEYCAGFYPIVVKLQREVSTMLALLVRILRRF
ncbi:hypothetical protein ElyMa_001695400 [Elysia marginata]|uniref:Uncharacterized protein n=1 Tax=Elysia marginata TaxID=1093978 RepID=A0AAV4JXV3_9GAST|nr:hypothetical protein ElyMa_001695400 [Elysia marginata]